MNTSALEEAFAKYTTVDELVKSVTAVIGDVINNNYPTSEVIPGIIVMDLRQLSGFYTDTRIIQEMVAIYVGRLMRNLIATQTGSSFVNQGSIQSVMKLLMSSNENEQLAVPLIINQCIKDYGDQKITNQKMYDKYINKMNATLNQ